MSKSLFIELSDELYQNLREYCFKHNTTKKKVVVNALSNLLGAKPSSVKPTPRSIKPTNEKLAESSKEEYWNDNSEFMKRLKERAEKAKEERY